MTLTKQLGRDMKETKKDKRRLLKTHEAADHLGVQPCTLEKWRQLEVGPPYIRISRRCVRYRMSDLERWASVNRFDPELVE